MACNGSAPSTGTATANPAGWTAASLPVDLAANAASLGVKVLKASTLVELKDALAKAKASETAVLVHVDTDLEYQSPGGDGWWDVPVAEVSDARLHPGRQAQL